MNKHNIEVEIIKVIIICLVFYFFFIFLGELTLLVAVVALIIDLVLLNKDILKDLFNGEGDMYE